jgi:spore cortex biosynthesis protein YabQ
MNATDVMLHVKLVALGLCAGAILGFLFDMYRIWRGIVHPGRLFTALGDLIFWLFAACAVGMFLFSPGWVEMRFYIVICMLAGLFFYRKLLSRPIVIITLSLLRLFSRTANAVLRSVFLPLRWVALVITVLYYRIQKLIMGFVSRIKIPFPKILKRI